MSKKKQHQHISGLISETLRLLCKSGLTYKTNFSIDALIGITLDEDEVFLVNIKETVDEKGSDNDSHAESLSEESSLEEAVTQDADGSAKKARKRKRKRNSLSRSQDVASPLAKIQKPEDKGAVREVPGTPVSEGTVKETDKPTDRTQETTKTTTDDVDSTTEPSGPTNDTITSESQDKETQRTTGKPPVAKFLVGPQGIRRVLIASTKSDFLEHTPLRNKLVIGNIFGKPAKTSTPVTTKYTFTPVTVKTENTPVIETPSPVKAKTSPNKAKATSSPISVRATSTPNTAKPSSTPPSSSKLKSLLRPTSSGAKPIIDPAHLEEAVSFVRDDGMSIHMAASLFRIPRPVLHHALGSPECASGSTYSIEQYNGAIAAVRAREMSAAEASKWFGIPCKTIEKHSRKLAVGTGKLLPNPSLGYTVDQYKNALDDILKKNWPVTVAADHYGVPSGALKNGLKRRKKCTKMKTYTDNFGNFEDGSFANEDSRLVDSYSVLSDSLVSPLGMLSQSSSQTKEATDNSKQSYTAIKPVSRSDQMTTWRDIPKRLHKPLPEGALRKSIPPRKPASRAVQTAAKKIASMKAPKPVGNYFAQKKLEAARQRYKRSFRTELTVRRCTEASEYSMANLDRAVNAVRQGKLSLAQAHAKYKIPRQTLSAWLYDPQHNDPPSAEAPAQGARKQDGGTRSYSNQSKRTNTQEVEAKGAAEADSNGAAAAAMDAPVNNEPSSIVVKSEPPDTGYETQQAGASTETEEGPLGVPPEIMTKAVMTVVVSRRALDHVARSFDIPTPVLYHHVKLYRKMLKKMKKSPGQDSDISQDCSDLNTHDKSVVVKQEPQEDEGFTPTEMNKAVHLVVAQHRSVAKISEQTGIPVEDLKRHVALHKSNLSKEIEKADRQSVTGTSSSLEGASSTTRLNSPTRHSPKRAVQTESSNPVVKSKGEIDPDKLRLDNALYKVIRMRKSCAKVAEEDNISFEALKRHVYIYREKRQLGLVKDKHLKLIDIDESGHQPGIAGTSDVTAGTSDIPAGTSDVTAGTSDVAAGTSDATNDEKAQHAVNKREGPNSGVENSKSKAKHAKGVTGEQTVQEHIAKKKENKAIEKENVAELVNKEYVAATVVDKENVAEDKIKEVSV